MSDRITGRIALLLISVALIFVVLLGWFVLISPEQSKASTLRSQVDDVSVQLQAVTSLLQGPIGRESFASLRVSRAAIPDDTKTSQILRELSSAASTTGIELDGIAFQPLVPVNGAEALPMAMTVRGRYFAIEAFLRQLRSEADLQNGKLRATGRLYTVDNIQFTGQAPVSSTQNTGATSLVQATLNVNAFVYAPTSLTGTPAITTPATTTSTAVAPSVP